MGCYVVYVYVYRPVYMCKSAYGTVGCLCFSTDQFLRFKKNLANELTKETLKANKSKEN